MTAGQPSPRRLGNEVAGWLVPAAVVTVIVGLVGWYVVTSLPVSHAVPEDFDIPGLTASSCGTSPSIYPPHDGDLQFSWSTNDGQDGTLSLLASPNGPGEVLQVYYNTSAGGSADWSTWSNYHYTFEFCGTTNETAQVSGTLYYSAPLL